MALKKEVKETMVKNQLTWDNRVLATDIDVEVSDSVAKLTGTVPTFYEKKVAEDDALSVPGILAVENDLSVSFPEGFTGVTDGEIKESIYNMLLWDSRIDSSSIDVTVDSGIVTLEGSVDAYWKKYEVGEIAHKVSGVVEVINNLNIVWTDSYEDKIIAEDIKNAFKRSVIVNTEDITVEVNNGIVTLSGVVSSMTEKQNAHKNALFTAGVIDVINDIEIARI